MSTKAEVGISGLDPLKLVAAALLVAGGIGGFYYFEGSSLLLRVLGLLAVVAVSLVIVLQTGVGRRVWRFGVDARTEVRKVVWPTRQETMQTTLIVFVMVLLMSFILWLVDMGLMAIVRALTGQGG
jgi:preprotein translocase subunit SecE